MFPRPCPRLLAAIAFAMLAGAASARSASAYVLPDGLIYASPVPGARYVQTQTTILLRPRFGRDYAVAELPDLQVTARGSVSGDHAGLLERLERGRLLRFTPYSAFTAAESVTVTLFDPDAASRHHPGPVTGYRFYVSASAAGNSGPPGLPELGDGGGGRPTPGEPAPNAMPAPGIGPLPQALPRVQVTSTGPTSPGVLFLGPFALGTAADQDYVMAVDDSGHVVFSRHVPGLSTDFKVQPDGRLTYGDAVAGKYYVLQPTGEVVDSVQCFGGYVTDPHELRLLPNGHWLLLGGDPQDINVGAVIPGGPAHSTLTGMVIQELDETRKPVFEWRSWDHFQLTDTRWESLTGATGDPVHSNAIEIDGDGNLLLSSRHMDEITKIDRRTGETIWRWGGANNQFTFLGDTLQFSHQHAIRRLPNGHYTLFDNGNHHVPPFSRAVEYELDPDAHTARVVWEYRATPDIFGAAMGYVQRLPDGHTLIGWGLGKPDVIELDSLGTPVMTLRLPQGYANYRVYRQPWPAGGATTGAPKPVATATGVAAPRLADPNDVAYDVPAAAPVSIAVFDIAGRRVRTVLDRAAREAGTYHQALGLSGQPAGVYFCRLEIGGKSETRIVMLAR